MPDTVAPPRITPQVQAWIRDPASFVLPAGVLTNHVVMPDREVTFAYTNPDDRIQRKHRRGPQVVTRRE